MREVVIILLRELERKNKAMAMRRERALTKAWLKRYKSMASQKEGEIQILIGLLSDIVSDGYLSLKSKEAIDEILKARNS